MQLTTKNNKLYLKLPDEPHFVNAVCSIPGHSWNEKFNCWQFPGTPRMAYNLYEILREQLGGLIFNQIKISSEFLQLASQYKPGPKPEKREFKFRTSPMPHQLKALERFYNSRGFMLAWDMGTGKSKMVVDLIANRNHKKTLILTVKKAVLGVWPGEFERHAPEGTKIKVLGFGDNLTVAQKQLQADNFLKALKEDEAGVIVINYESAWREPFRKWAIHKAKFDFVVFDESQKIQAAGSKVSMFCSILADHVTWKVALTGTPLYSGPHSLYGQYRALDKSVFGTNYKQFLNRYAILDPEYNRILKYINQEELARKMFSIANRVTREEVLSLPDKREQIIYFDLNPKARKIYDDLERAFMAEIGQAIRQAEAGLIRADKAVLDELKFYYGEAPLPELQESTIISASNVLVQRLRLTQLTGGYLPAPENPQAFLELDSGKYECLLELLDGLPPDEPVVVFGLFKQDLKLIKAAFNASNRKCLEISGSRDDLKEWQAGAAPGLAVQIAAGGAGIDLTRSCYCIYYSTGDNLNDFDQSAARIYRNRQNRNCFFYFLHARKSIDEKIYQNLERKREINEKVFAMQSAN